MTEIELQKRFPSIPWREALPVRLTNGGGEGLGCRLCIAMYGLHGSQVAALPHTKDEFDQHMKEKHGQATNAKAE